MSPRLATAPTGRGTLARCVSSREKPGSGLCVQSWHSRCQAFPKADLGWHGVVREGSPQPSGADLGLCVAVDQL